MKKKNNDQKIGRKALTTVRQYFPGVKVVNDATKPIIVEVTPADNKKAKIQDHANCAFAVACMRTQKADGVLVARTVSYIIFGKMALRYKVPGSVRTEEIAFDREGKGGFLPGQYQLRPPSDYERLGSHPTGTTRNPSGRKARGFRHITQGVRAVLGK